MKRSFTSHFFVQTAVGVCAMTLLLAGLTGCGLGTITYEPTAAVSATTYSVSGTVQPGNLPQTVSHLGLQPNALPPVSGATVWLYAVGTAGYGSNATLLARTTTSTNGGGSFSFVQNSAHVNSLSTISNTYSCPSYRFTSPDGTATISKDSYIYLVASQGDTQDGTGTAQNNRASVMMASLGDCQALAQNEPFVVVNPVTTVATVYALSPYFNPNYPTATVNGVSTILPGGAVGTSTSYMTDYGAEVNGGYTTTGSKKSQATAPLGYAGMANAFDTVNRLATLGTGQVVPNFSHTSTLNGNQKITLLGFPEAAKINTIADILSYCISTSDASSAVSAQCSALFAHAAPPVSGGSTSLGAGTVLSTAVDTLQVAYYMATNPTDNTAYGADTHGSTTNLGVLFSYVSATSPFQPTLTAQPTDWTVSITYASSELCGTDPTPTGFAYGDAGGDPGYYPYFLDLPTQVGVDLQGNLAVRSSGENESGYYDGAPLATISNAGAPTACLFGTTLDFYGSNIFYDQRDSIWTASDPSAPALYQTAPSLATTVWPIPPGRAAILITSILLRSTGPGMSWSRNNPRWASRLRFRGRCLQQHRLLLRRLGTDLLFAGRQWT